MLWHFSNNALKNMKMCVSWWWHSYLHALLKSKWKRITHLLLDTILMMVGDTTAHEAYWRRSAEELRDLCCVLWTVGGLWVAKLTRATRMKRYTNIFMPLYPRWTTLRLDDATIVSNHLLYNIIIIYGWFGGNCVNVIRWSVNVFVLTPFNTSWLINY